MRSFPLEKEGREHWCFCVVDGGFGFVDGGFDAVDGGFRFVDSRFGVVDGEFWVCLCLCFFFFFLPLMFWVCMCSKFFCVLRYCPNCSEFVWFFFFFFMRICIFFWIYGFDFLEVSMLTVLEFFEPRLILSGLVNWVCLDLEKNMKNEVHVLGWRFLGLTFF